MTYDGFIGGDYCEDDYNEDLSGELISIEDTYKEVSLYKKSGGPANKEAAGKSQPGAAGINAGNPAGISSAGTFATAGNVHGQNYEELKQSQ